MNLPGGGRTLMTLLEVLAGAGIALTLKNKVIKQSEVAGMPTELVVALGALALAIVVGGDWGKTLAMGAAGAAGVGVMKLPQVAQLTGEGTTVAGLPYIVGGLPSGGAFYSLPPNAQGQQAHQQLAGIAALS